MKKQHDFATRAIHAGQEPDPTTGAIMTPIYATSTYTQATLPANYKFTSSTGLDNGIHSFTPGVTLKTVGTQSVTATDTVTANITGSQTGIVVVSNAATTLVVSGVSSPQVAGTTSSFRVEARDAAGNIARGYTGTVRISTTDGQATRPADHTFTTSDAGIYTFSSLILRTSATQSVTATDIATSSMTGTQRPSWNDGEISTSVSM